MSGLGRRTMHAVRGAGPLAWLGLAWLAGPLPGQGTDGLWWWHAGAAVLLVVVAALAVTGRRPDRPPLRWQPGTRWHVVVVTGWLSLAVIAAAQLARGVASTGDLATFAGAAVIAALAPPRSVGGAAVDRFAGGAVLLALLTVVVALGQLDALDGPFAYYRLKQEVVTPVGGHNVLASVLLVATAAVAVGSLRWPRLTWALGLVGLALGATLSRGAVLAGLVAVLVALVGLRDRAVARRAGAAVGIAAVVVGIALATLGAPVPDPDGPPSALARAELWAAAARATADEPVVGVGLDGFAAYAANDGGVAAPHAHAHDLLLHAGATTGLPGLVATGAVWIGLAVGAAGQVDRDRRTMVLVALAGLAAHAMVEETAFTAAVEGLLALLVVVVAAPRDPAATRT